MCGKVNLLIYEHREYELTDYDKKRLNSKITDNVSQIINSHSSAIQVQAFLCPSCPIR